VFDLYQEAVERHRAELSAWQKRKSDKKNQRTRAVRRYEQLQAPAGTIEAFH
jgi:hypothetical protein